MLFTEPIVSFVRLYCSFQFALLHAFLVGFLYVYSVTYSLSMHQQGLPFLGLATGAACAAPALIAMDYYTYQAKYHTFREITPASELPPKHRLYPFMLGSVVLPIDLFLFAWTVRPSTPWIVPIITENVTMLGAIPLTSVRIRICLTPTARLTELQRRGRTVWRDKFLREKYEKKNIEKR
ncbi:uncharacterized protein BDR25DRAFT_376712 [Lindgomyces ingoldianus]|uniref:Uncharacterized protein n=1 Tax=Lindgomyces ingoldianus TaxID=673940 RepID=A0ACB6QKP6_9PLEO|nr:uncharacterized protein BDR25DRAFT_376712 [Lindgomyces ingoldianus]KAF2467095.1 hypothetical protein BDR25DRAFT_376712 [Lindgomyces ingoldianus]